MNLMKYTIDLFTQVSPIGIKLRSLFPGGDLAKCSIFIIKYSICVKESTPSFSSKAKYNQE